MTRILLLNDTGASVNPGCQAVTAAIHRLYRHKYGVVQFRSLPVGYGAEQTVPRGSTLVGSAGRLLSRLARRAARPWRGGHPYAATDYRYPCWTEAAAPVAPSTWQHCIDRAGSDARLADLAAWADLVVINGEGTVHHNQPRALALLAQAHMLLARGLRIHLINATIQATDRPILEQVLPHLELVHVREQHSRDSLCHQLGLQLLMTPDLAYAYFDPLPQGDGVRIPEVPGVDCLITSGVLADQEVIGQHITVARRRGFAPGYYLVSDRGERTAAEHVCAAQGIPLIHPEDVPLPQVVPFLRQFQVVLTGRHHIAIFCTLAGVPFVPLPSNTWKVEATMELVGYPVRLCPTAADLAGWLDRVLESPQHYQQQSAAAGQAGLAQVREFSRHLDRMP